MPTESSTPLITNDIVGLGLIAATLALIFWLASGPTPFWKKFFAWVPALLLCYFVPAFYNTVGLIDGENSTLYNPLGSRILLPAALPGILTGMRLSIGIAWLVIVAAEMLTGGIGIGFWIWNEWNNLNVENIIIAILVIGVVGLLLEQGLMWIASRFNYSR